MATRTNSLTHQCLNLLEMRGCVAWRNNVGSMPLEYHGRKRFLRFGEKGSGDILAILPPLGQFASIEIKTGRDQLRESQCEWMERIENVGALTCVVREIEDLTAFLDDVLVKPKVRKSK
jgi:hypothetical protein